MNTEKILSSAGLRTTRQRRVILELLIRHGSPMSHSEILSMIDDHLDRVTLYRTLDTLKNCAKVIAGVAANIGADWEETLCLDD